MAAAGGEADLAAAGLAEAAGLAAAGLAAAGLAAEAGLAGDPAAGVAVEAAAVDVSIFFLVVLGVFFVAEIRSKNTSQHEVHAGLLEIQYYFF